MSRPEVGPCICGRKGYAKGLCRSHYEKMKRSDRERRVVPSPARTCKEPDCYGKYYAKGWCRKHYNRSIKRIRPNRYVPRPPRPEFYNPLVPKIEDMALSIGQHEIARLLGETIGTVSGIIWRARQAMRIPNPMEPPDHVPTPDRFPRSGCCLYMEGDPKNPMATFCGKPAFIIGEPWCAKHRAIVYRPPLEISIPFHVQSHARVVPEAAD